MTRSDDRKFPVDPTVVASCFRPEVEELAVVMKKGVGVVTVKVSELLPALLTVTTTGPVVAPVGTVVIKVPGPQLDTVAAVPLKVSVLFPWLDPKFAPLTVTVVPTGPEETDRPLMVGAGGGGAFTTSVTVTL